MAGRQGSGIRDQKVVHVARSYIGTAWRHQGRSRAGLDCVGLVYRVWCDLGLDTSVDGTGYGHVSDGRWLRETVERLLRRVPGPRPGGVVVMAQQGMHPLHVGIIGTMSDDGGIGSIIHANARARAVIEQAFVPALRLRPIAYYEFPEADFPMKKRVESSEKRETMSRSLSRSPVRRSLGEGGSLLLPRFSAAPEAR